MDAVGIIITFIIVLECFQKDKTSGILVAKQLETVVGGFLKITEGYDVAMALYGVEYAVGTRVGLQQAMISQILVNPKGVECCGIETGEEHIDHY